MRRLTIPPRACARCNKGTTIGFNRPHSLHKTKRVIHPNLQPWRDPESKVRFLLCTRCIRTLSK